MLENWVGKYVWVGTSKTLVYGVLSGLHRRGVYFRPVRRFEISEEFASRQAGDENWSAVDEELEGERLITWSAVRTIRPDDETRFQYC